jgi:ribosome-binding factor A
MCSKKRSSQNSQRERLLEMCGQLHEDDCVDPNQYFKPNRKLDVANKKAKQLCRQALETLEMVLSDCDEELMQSLVVAGVDPAPDSSRLLVTVGVDLEPDEFDQSLILSILQNQTPRLRAELARSISRKRVPNLSYRIFSKAQLEQPSIGTTDTERPANYENFK